MAVFRNPAGEIVERDEDEIEGWEDNSERPSIDLGAGDGHRLTSGIPKDAEWTAGLMAEGDDLGLHTSGWWEAAPDYIQGKVDAAKRQATWSTPTSSPKRSGPTEAEKAALKKEAWDKDKASLEGPTDWTAYWNAARRATGEGGVPSWLTALNTNQRIPAFAGFGAIPKPQMPTTYEDYEPWANLELNPRSTNWMTGLDAGVRDSLRVPAAHQVGLGQWANLLPSEKLGLRGLVESQGGNFADWDADMRRS